MKRLLAAPALLGLVLLVPGLAAPAQKPEPAVPPAGTVVEDRGAVVKVDKDVVVFQPRMSDGKFGPAIKLGVTGTTRLTQLQVQMRGKEVVLAQTEIKYQALTGGMSMSAVYASTGSELVLLSGVVHPKRDGAPGKDVGKDK